MSQEILVKKLIIFLILLAFLAVSCSSSKKAENDIDTDILPDDDTAITDEDTAEEEEEDNYDDDEDTDETGDSSPCENFANTDGTILYYENGNFECGCAEGYFWGNPGCKKITFANICTGQEYCYENNLYDHTYYCSDKNNPPGQDGYYAKEGYCLKQDFTQKNYYAGETTSIDDNLKIEWMNKVTGHSYTWEEAVDFCENLEYGGRDDWRLPLPRELLIAAPNEIADKTELWSSVSLGENAWYINDKHNLELGYKLMEAAIRCVREDPEPEGEYTSSSPRFQTIRINNAEIVRDLESGIIWQKKWSGNLRWIDSMVLCENSSYAGFYDWRMPNINELTSLADHKNGGVSNFPGFESDLSEPYFWSSSTNDYENEYSSSYEDEMLYYSHTLDISDGRNVNIQITDYCGVVANALCIRNDPCRSGWFWNGKKCVESPCNSDPCKNDEHSDGECIIENLGKYSCGCAENYFWNGKKCVSPCDPNPCDEDKNSTGLCIVSAKDSYKCECRDGWFWDGVKCVNPCEDADCGNPEHGTGCKAYSAFAYSCGCDEGYWWWGKEKGCKARKPATANICTAQNKCYDNEKESQCPAEGKEFSGQDAYYASLGYCAPQNFSIDYTTENEPVIVDNNLGMMWQRNIPQAEVLPVGSVISYCENLVYGGYNDWKLPTEEEFITIADFGRYSPGIDTEYFPDAGSFWTSTNYTTYEDSYNNQIYSHSTTEHYKIFDFTELSAFQVETYSSYSTGSYGEIGNSGSRSYPHSFNIRCVRGTDISGSALIFTQETLGENIWWNYGNDLIFMKNDTASLTWSEALKYCSELDYAGISDWRLPNIKEHPLNFAAEGHTSTTKLSDLSSDYPYKKDEKRENILCVTNNPCENGKIWNGVKCIKNPCSGNPCQSDTHSDKICKVINEKLYSCGCDETYYWSQSKAECRRSCDVNPCDDKEHSDGVCLDDETEGYRCGCNEGYIWLDYECQENCCEPNRCENLADSDGICRILGTSIGHPYCYCGCVEGYSWDPEDFFEDDWTSKGKCVKE